MLVPAGGRVTFDPCVPQRPQSDNGPRVRFAVDDSPRFRYALRIYQGNNLLAVFTDVYGFRPDDMQIQKYTEATTGEWAAKAEAPWIVAEAHPGTQFIPMPSATTYTGIMPTWP